jgi:hypothetical protein
MQTARLHTMVIASVLLKLTDRFIVPQDGTPRDDHVSF